MTIEDQELAVYGSIRWISVSSRLQLSADFEAHSNFRRHEFDRWRHGAIWRAFER